MLVTITHPKLPGREVQVHEESLPHHERAGWKRKTRKAAVIADVPKEEE